MKPGGSTSAAATMSDGGKCLTTACAMARGGILAALAACIATVDE